MVENIYQILDNLRVMMYSYNFHIMHHETGALFNVDDL